MRNEEGIDDIDIGGLTHDNRLTRCLSPLNAVKLVLLAKEDPELYSHMLITAKALMITDWDQWIGQLIERHLDLNRALGRVSRFWACLLYTSPSPRDS